MTKPSSGQNLVNLILSYLALALNIFEQIGLITSKFSILPNFFVKNVGSGAQTFAGFISLILSGVVIALLWFGFSSGFSIDFRGFVVKKGKVYNEDVVIPYFWTVFLLIIIEVLLITTYVSIGLGAANNWQIWFQYSIQLLVYVLFWALLTYFFSYFLKSHLDRSKYEEGRRQYTYDLFETIERSNTIRTDSKLSLVAVFVVQFADRLNFVVARNKYFLVLTTYNASELKYALEVKKARFEQELENLVKGGSYPLNRQDVVSSNPTGMQPTSLS